MSSYLVSSYILSVFIFSVFIYMVSSYIVSSYIFSVFIFSIFIYIVSSYIVSSYIFSVFTYSVFILVRGQSLMARKISRSEILNKRKRVGNNSRFVFNIRPKKKIVLFPEIGRVKIFLSPTRPYKSNVYENIYFFFKKNTHTNKKISTNKFIATNLRLFAFKKQKIGLFVFQQGKVLLE